MKIIYRLFLFFLILSTVAILVTGGLSYYSAHEALREQTISGLRSTLNSRISHIKNKVILRQEEGAIIAGTYLARQLRSDGNNDPQDIARLQQHLDYIIGNLRHSDLRADENTDVVSSLEYVGIRDVEGKVIANTNHQMIGVKPYMPPSFYTRINKEGFVFDGYAYDSLTGRHFLMVYSVIHDHRDGKFAGFVVLKINNHNLKRICFDFEGLGQTGEFLLAQKVGDSIRFIIPVRNGAGLPEVSFDSHHALPIQLALSGKEGGGVVVNYAGKEVLAVWRPINELGWGISLELETAEAFAPIAQLRNRVLISLLLMAGIIIAFYIFYFSRSVVTSVDKLVSVFTRISRGEVVENVEVDTKDEFGKLSEAANETIGYLNRIIAHADRLSREEYFQDFVPRDANDRLGNALQKMTQSLREFDRLNRETIWLQNAISKVNDALRGDSTLNDIADRVLRVIASETGAALGAFYRFSEETGLLHFSAGFALPAGSNVNELAPGAGIAGQAALEQKVMVVSPVPRSYFKINSLLGETEPAHLIAIPLLFKGRLRGVMELGSLSPFTPLMQQYLEDISEVVAVAVTTAENRKRIQELLEESQAQTEELSQQQEEMQQQTHRLMASEEELKQQQDELVENNRQLEEKSLLLQQKASELEKISRFKSEFMANMSHELRTPLNSIMLLSKLLGNNTQENLTGEQLEFARIIYNSGNTLLTLINDILDLTKIEAEKMELHLSKTDFRSLCSNLDENYLPLAKEKGITYTCQPGNKLPEYIISDSIRLEQILKNLISNAFKFTEQGEISMEVMHLTAAESEKESGRAEEMIRFTVSDTGIGIEPEKLEVIFEAFQQADGSTRRKYGGTGLGLSISRQIASLLGGLITVKSVPGKGSAFSLYIPVDSTGVVASGSGTEVADSVRLETPAVTHTGSSPRPAPKNAKVLVVEDNLNHRLALVKFLQSMGVECLEADSVAAALTVINREGPGCIILDMGLPDANGYDLLENIKKNKHTAMLPVLVYTGMSLSQDDEKKLNQYADAIIIKTANSYRRLADELLLALNRSPLGKGTAFPYIKDTALKNKTILLVDDDVRNIYSISKLLESHGMNVITALNGAEALSLLGEKEGVEMVLMDMMMPEMDGYTAIGKIREEIRWKKLPVIAVTARAMIGDREKCLKAGASDYVTKPVDGDQLLALIRIWLYK